MRQQNLRSLRIAVADDEPIILRYYQLLIPQLGHQVVGVARNGQELLDCCRDFDPDLAITDVQMPHLNGWAVIAQCEVPFVIISAQDKPEGIHEQFRDRLIGYLTKPIKRADLQRVLESALQ